MMFPLAIAALKESYHHKIEVTLCSILSHGQEIWRWSDPIKPKERVRFGTASDHAVILSIANVSSAVARVTFVAWPLRVPLTSGLGTQ
jgi:hypothetical protein